jgi:hypothetical protein
MGAGSIRACIVMYIAPQFPLLYLERPLTAPDEQWAHRGINKFVRFSRSFYKRLSTSGKCT